MGDMPAHFKTIRLCSITPVLSNTIAVVINSFSRLPAREQFRGPAAKIAEAAAQSAGSCVG
jgi:hypothetical protein